MNLFEDRSTYDHVIDPVEHITVQIECHPGVIASVIEHIISLGAKAGMYSASVTHETVIPVIEVPVAEPEKVEEVPNVEPEIQRIVHDEGTEVGTGSITAEGGVSEIPTEHIGSEVAWTAGEIPAGSESGNPGGEDLRSESGIIGWK